MAFFIKGIFSPLFSLETQKKQQKELKSWDESNPYSTEQPWIQTKTIMCTEFLL